MDARTQLKNRWASFKLRDVFVPPAQEVMERLHAEDLLHGRIIGFTDKGPSEEVYVIVEVLGLDGAVVVPLPRIVSVM